MSSADKRNKVPRLGITKVSTSDREFDDQEVVNFIVQCFVETGGLQGVKADLREKGLWDLLSPGPYDLLDDAKRIGLLNLGAQVSSTQLHAICTSIIDTLEDHQDLEILAALTYEEAQHLLKQLTA